MGVIEHADVGEGEGGERGGAGGGGLSWGWRVVVGWGLDDDG